MWSGSHSDLTGRPEFFQINFSMCSYSKEGRYCVPFTSHVTLHVHVLPIITSNLPFKRYVDLQRLPGLRKKTFQNVPDVSIIFSFQMWSGSHNDCLGYDREYSRTFHMVLQNYQFKWELGLAAIARVTVGNIPERSRLFLIILISNVVWISQRSHRWARIFSNKLFNVPIFERGAILRAIHFTCHPACSRPSNHYQ